MITIEYFKEIKAFYKIYTKYKKCVYGGSLNKFPHRNEEGLTVKFNIEDLQLSFEEWKYIITKNSLNESIK